MRIHPIYFMYCIENKISPFDLPQYQLLKEAESLLIHNKTTYILKKKLDKIGVHVDLDTHWVDYEVYRQDNTGFLMIGDNYCREAFFIFKDGFWQLLVVLEFFLDMFCQFKIYEIDLTEEEKRNLVQDYVEYCFIEKLKSGKFKR